MNETPRKTPNQNPQDPKPNYDPSQNPRDPNINPENEPREDPQRPLNPENEPF